MGKPRPQFIEEARLKGDTELLRRCGLKAARKRRQAAEERRRHQALVEWVSNPDNYLEECWKRDEECNLHICPLDD